MYHAAAKLSFNHSIGCTHSRHFSLKKKKNILKLSVNNHIVGLVHKHRIINEIRGGFAPAWINIYVEDTWRIGTRRELLMARVAEWSWELIFTDYGGVEDVGRLNDVCWRNLDACVVYCNNGFGGIECEE